MPTAAAEPGVTRDHKCQTPQCPNDFSVIMIRVDDSETDMLCETCTLAFWLAVLQKANETGVLPGEGTPPA